MAGSCYRRVGVSQAALVILTLLRFSGIAFANYTSQQINQECAACDTSALAAINTYHSDFGNWSKAIDGAMFYCGRFAKLRSCYTNCLHGTMYKYSSIKSIFEQFYSGVCDPVCYLAVLPYCYTLTVGTYDVTMSCTGANMNQDLKRCVQTELFVNQNCSGVCTQGQRKALFYFFSTMLQCKVPYQTASDCFSWTRYCSETIFGYNGAAYVNYANETVIGSNRLGCSTYGDAYLECVQQAIDGDVILGSPPNTVTYSSPCADLTAQLKFLTDFVYGMLVAPFCENPDQSFNDTCQAYAALPTISTSSEQTLSTPAVPTSRATAQAALPTTRATSEALSTTRSSRSSSSVAVPSSTVTKRSVPTTTAPYPVLALDPRTANVAAETALLMTTSGDGLETAGRNASAVNGQGILPSVVQPLTPTTITSAAVSRPAYMSTAVISGGEQTRADGPASSSPSVAVLPSTAATRPVSITPKPFASLEDAYRQIILQNGSAIIALADPATVAALLAFVAVQSAGIGFV